MYSIKFRIKELTLKRVIKSSTQRCINLGNAFIWLIRIKTNKISVNRKSERAVLLANGPSLANLDISKIDGTWDIYGMNRVYLDSKISQRLKAIFLVNRLVAKQFNDDFKNLAIPLVVPSNLVRLFRNSKSVDILYFNPLMGGFAKEINDSFNPSSTVTYFALQALFVLGYKEVVLLGLDHNFGVQNRVNQTEEVENDIHHFRKDYFPKGIKWETPDLFGSEFWYKRANDEYKLAKKRIIDATHNGSCFVFEKASFNEIFSSENKNDL